MPTRRDLVVSAVLAVLTCATRLPFVGTILYHWDSINFALALERFDVAAAQPHVPGYPLYVLLCRAVHVLLPDAQHALAAISVFSSGLAVGALYLLGVEMFDRSVALLAALLMASSPLYWFYGEIALPHSLDAFVVIGAVWLLHRCMRGDMRMLLPVAIWIGVAGGLRPQTQLFITPLAIFAVWYGARDGALTWRRVAIALVALMVVDLIWFVPLVMLSGGLRNYLQITRDFYMEFNSTTSIVSGGGAFGLRRNAIKLTLYTLYAWGAGLPLLFVGLASKRFAAIARPSETSHAGSRGVPWVPVFLLWVLPTVLYYQFIHMGQQGLVFVFLPALCLLSAVAIDRPTILRWPSIVAAVAANAIIFLASPTFPLGEVSVKLLTADTLRQHDEIYESRLRAVRSRFDPRHTVIVSAAWRFPQYYLRDYFLLRYDVVLKWELNEGTPRIKDAQDFGPADLGVEPDAEGFRYAVIFDDELLTFNPDTARREWIDLGSGSRLAFLRLVDKEGIRLQPDSFYITEPGATDQTEGTR